MGIITGKAMKEVAARRNKIGYDECRRPRGGVVAIAIAIAA